MNINSLLRELSGSRPSRWVVDRANLDCWHPSTTDIHIPSLGDSHPPYASISLLCFNRTPFSCSVVCIARPRCCADIAQVASRSEWGEEVSEHNPTSVSLPTTNTIYKVETGNPPAKFRSRPNTRIRSHFYGQSQHRTTTCVCDSIILLSARRPGVLYLLHRVENVVFSSTQLTIIKDLLESHLVFARFVIAVKMG